MIELKAEHVMHIVAQCTPDLEVGKGLDGTLRVIPIVGGTVEGKVNGTIVSGGADWNTSKENHIAHVFAKYLLKADNGEYIAIENEGVVNFADQEQLIITTPRFTVNQNGAYGWLNYGVFVGSLKGSSIPNAVEIDIYKMC